MENDLIARFKEYHMDGHTEGLEAAIARQKQLGALKYQLRNKESTLTQTRAELVVATRKLKALRLRAKKVEKKLLIAQTDVLLLTTTQKKVREQLDAKVAELEELQSRLDMREAELIPMHDTQTKVAAEPEPLRPQTANNTSESVEVHSTAGTMRDPRNMRRLVVVSGTVSERHRLRPIAPYSQTAMSSRFSVKR